MLLDGDTLVFLILLMGFFLGGCVSLSFWNRLNWFWDGNLVSSGDGAHVVSVQSSQELLMFSLVGHLFLESDILGNRRLVEGLLLAHIVILDLAEDLIDLILLILWHDVFGEFTTSLLWMHVFGLLLDFSLIILVVIVRVGNDEASLVLKRSDKVSESKDLSLIFWSVLNILGLLLDETSFRCLSGHSFLMGGVSLELSHSSKDEIYGHVVEIRFSVFKVRMFFIRKHIIKSIKSKDLAGVDDIN